MSYEVLLHPKANKFFEKSDSSLEKRIRGKLDTLSSEPKKGKKLKHSNFRRLRIGNHRAIYEIKPSKEKVVVLFIGHRKDVYVDFSSLI